MANPEKYLLLLLRVFAGVMLLAFIAVFFPFSLMRAIHDSLGFGAETLPDMPIIGYLTRTASLLYGTMGILYMLISFDLPRYAPLLRVFCWMPICYGPVMVFIDIRVGMRLVVDFGGRAGGLRRRRDALVVAALLASAGESSCRESWSALIVLPKVEYLV